MKGNFKGVQVWIAALALVACGSNGTDGAGPVQDTARVQQRTTVTDGPAKEYDINGRLQMEGHMQAGQRHGLWTSYFPGGRVRSRSEYLHGRLEGVATVFRENGNLYYTGQYRNDRQTGEWRFYDELGNLERTVRYDTTGAVINDPGAGL